MVLSSKHVEGLKAEVVMEILVFWRFTGGLK